MAHCIEQSIQTAEEAEMAAQVRVRNHVSRVFGCQPQSVRFERCGPIGLLCFVRMRVGVGDPVEFIMANGVLVGFPPKGQGKL